MKKKADSEAVPEAASETARQHILSMFEPVTQCIDQAEAASASAQSEKAVLQAELDRLMNQKCPDCGKPLTVDGGCYNCQMKNFPTGDSKDSYARGAKDIFQALMTFTPWGENGLHSSTFNIMLESCWEERFEPDRKAAAEKARVKVARHGAPGLIAHPTATNDWLK